MTSWACFAAAAVKDGEGGCWAGHRSGRCESTAQHMCRPAPASAGARQPIRMAPIALLPFLLPILDPLRGHVSFVLHCPLCVGHVSVVHAPHQQQQQRSRVAGKEGGYARGGEGVSCTFHPI